MSDGRQDFISAERDLHELFSLGKNNLLINNNNQQKRDDKWKSGLNIHDGKAVAIHPIYNFDRDE